MHDLQYMRSHSQLPALTPNYMAADTKRHRLVNAIKKRPALMEQRLKLLKRAATDIRGRSDLLWLLLLQSLSTQGRSAGWTNLAGNHGQLQSLAFSQLSLLPENERVIRLQEVLSAANVRFPQRKAVLLARNIAKIQKMGGLEAANKAMLAQRTYDEKIRFIKRFDGIDEKYGRNIWMDTYDREFRQSIAVDSRLNSIGVALGLWEKKSKKVDREALLKEIAIEARIDPWDLDRLLYTYTAFFLAEIIGVSEPPPTLA